MGPRMGPNAGYGPLALVITSHGLVAGDGPLTVNAAVFPAPLAFNTPYYAVPDPVSTSRFLLATSRANALSSTTITLLDAGSGARTVTTTEGTASSLSSLVGYSDTFTSSFGDGWVTLVASGTEIMADGDGPVRLTTTGTLPAPLVAATDYWLINVNGAPSASGDTRQFATSYANAIARTAITLLDDGLGVHTIASTGASQHRAALTLANNTPFTVS